MTVEDAGGKKKLKYPKSVFFIICNEFCERFSFYGMRTVLSLYLVDILLYSENSATVIFHAFTMFAYLFPLLGAIVADSWLGKFRIIFYLSIVYALGQLLLSASSMPQLHLPVREMSILGLFLIALGTGGIKPCVSAFGGDQFKLPEQEAQLSTFFSVFYFAINSGSLLSTFVTPILRKDYPCFGKNTCYPLTFFVPFVLMILSIVVFLSGKSLYKIKEPEGNVILNVVKCVSHAIGRKISSKENRSHWLDYADDRFERRMIEDVKSVMGILKLFIPLPIFWALFDQQGSRWTFQATRMDGEVFGYLIKPDQFQLVNPLFIILLIPIFQYYIYPVIEKFLFINTPLRKITVGGFIAGLSFIVSGIVELKLEPTYIVEPSNGKAQVRIFNTVNCNATISLDNQKFILDALGLHSNISVPARGVANLNFSATYDNCPYVNNTPSIEGFVEAKEGTARTWILTKERLSKEYEDVIKKSKTGDPFVRAFIYMEGETPGLLKMNSGKDSYDVTTVKKDYFNLTFVEVIHNKYEMSLYGQPIAEDVFPRYGGVYTIVGYVSKDNKTSVKLVTVAEPNSVHIFWLLPQYIVITVAEIMFSITGLEFAFTQAPVSMKSLLQASWLLTVTFGNLIVIIIAKAQFFKRQVFEFFLFAGLMFIDLMVFAMMTKNYKYVEAPNSSNDNSVNDNINLDLKNGKVNDVFSEDL